MNDYKYQFKRDDAFSIANHLNISVKEQGYELHFKQCPYCRGGNNGDKYTFSISLENGTFKCLRSSCSMQGHIYQLAKDFDYKLTDDFSRYYQKRETYKSLPQPKAKVEPTAETVSYLETRGISKATAEKYQITARNDNPDILCFPVFDENKKLVNIKYRNTKYKKGDKGNKEWFEAGCKPYLYGIQAWNGKYDRFVLTEGQMDSLACYEAGIQNAFSVLGGKNAFTWFPACYDFISKFEELVIFGDYENGNITLLDDMKIRFKHKIRHVRFEDYKDCKDANDILLKYGAEHLKACVDRAEFVPMQNVVEVADVEDVDIYKLKKVGTGIYQIDKILYGGLPFGGVSLVSGCAGEGKSTLTSQIMVNAISQGFKCFCYSGELPNYLFKQWMNFQVAGRKRIFENTNKWGDKQYNISNANKAMISNWYRGKIYLYDNSSIDDSNTETLCQTLEKVIVQYGTEVILLDNLMTAISLEPASANDLQTQTELLKKLTRIAVKFNVLIILVAHKRKNQSSTNENNEVMGSSNIVNLAMLTISYGKSSDLGEEQRLCKISKNRLFGKTDTTGFPLYYDEKSKRIYGKGDDLDVDFGWDIDNTPKKINFDISIENDSPFH